MAHVGYESWVVAYSDTTLGSYSQPQAISVNSESLDFGLEMRKRNVQLSSVRGQGTSSNVPISVTPKGKLNFPLRSDDCLKFFLAHFQDGEWLGTSYLFKPIQKATKYRNTIEDDKYFNPFTISLLKKVYSYSGDNAFWFKNGIVESLNLDLSTGQETALEASLRFTSVDYGTTVQEAPTGSYSPLKPFESWSATVRLDNQSIGISRLSLNSNNKLQESINLGGSTPSHFRFMDYQMQGQMEFDLPDDSIKYVGSLFGTKTFSLTATLYNSGTDSIYINLPECIRLPFNYPLTQANNNLKAAIPFEVCWNSDNPISIGVHTSSLFTALTAPAIIFDADTNGRNTGTFILFDASTDGRNTGTFILFDRLI